MVKWGCIASPQFVGELSLLSAVRIKRRMLGENRGLSQSLDGITTPTHGN